MICAAIVLVLVFGFSLDALNEYSKEQRTVVTGNICNSASAYLSEKLCRFQALSVSELIDSDRTNIRLTLEMLVESNDKVFIILCNTDGTVCAYIDADGYTEDIEITLPQGFVDEFLRMSKNSTVFPRGIEGITDSRTEAYVNAITDKALSVYGHCIVCTTDVNSDSFVTRVTQRVVIALVWSFLAGVFIYYIR